MQRGRSPRAEVYKLPWREERAPPKPGGVKFPSCILKRGARPVTPPARPSPPQAIRPGTLAPPNAAHRSLHLVRGRARLELPGQIPLSRHPGVPSLPTRGACCPTTPAPSDLEYVCWGVGRPL